MKVKKNEIIPLTHRGIDSIGSLRSAAMQSISTYTRHPRPARWSQCAGMFLRIGKPGFGFRTKAGVTMPGIKNHHPKEAGR